MGAIFFHNDGEGSVGNKEEQKRGAHTLQCTQEKLTLVEEKVLLAGFVQAGVAQTVLVTDIL